MTANCFNLKILLNLCHRVNKAFNDLLGCVVVT